MEVFQSSGQEGVLTVCLDGGETIHLNFKKGVQVSVKYSTQKSGNDYFASAVCDLKKEESETDDVVKKSDPLDEELNGFIERVKNTEGGDRELFSNPAKDLFVENMDDSNTQSGDDEYKKLCGINEEERDEDKNDGADSNGDDDNGLDYDESIVDLDENYDDLDESSDIVSSQNASDIVNDVRDGDSGGENHIKNNETSTTDISLKMKYVDRADLVEIDESDTETLAVVTSKEKPVDSVKDDCVKKVNLAAGVSDSGTKNLHKPGAPVKDRYLYLKEKKTSTVFKCNLCERIFSDSYLLSIHHRPRNSKVKCKMCDLECMSKANLIVHENLMHSKSGKISGKMCPICFKPFQKHSDILNHIRCKHTNEGVYRCCVCRTLFQNYQTFKFHLDTHEINKRKLQKDALSKGKNLSARSSTEVINFTASAEASRTKTQPPIKVPRMSIEPVATTSKRKSSTPVQLRSSMNFQPPSPPLPKLMRPTVLLKPLNMATPISTKTGKTQTSTSKTQIPASKTQMIANPQIKAQLAGSKPVISPIKKQALTQRLRPVVTPSTLPSRKRPLNQLPSKVKPMGQMPKVRVSPAVSLAPPKVSQSPQSEAVTEKRKYVSSKRSLTKNKLWKCHFCERVFKTKAEYISHKKPLRIAQMCKQCGFTSTSKALYLIHEYQKHTNQNNDRYTIINEDLRCHICEDPITLNEVLNHLMIKHTEENPYECCVCKKPSASYDEWVNHGKSHVRSEEEKNSLSTNKLTLELTVKTEEAQKNNEIFCNLCKHYHPNEKEFVRHHKPETQKKQCEVCEVMCYTKAGYLIHQYISHGFSETGEGNKNVTKLTPASGSDGNLKLWHEDDVSNDSNSEKTECPTCSESFPLRDLLPHVTSVHTLEPLYKCCACKENCSKLDQYIDHCNFHLGKRPYNAGTQRCLVCGLRFETRIRLSRHKIMHKPSCPFCKMEFNSKALLDVHLKNFHKKEMTPCSFCGKLFAHNNQLAEHERNHFFYKETPCHICGVSVSNLSKHVDRMHPKPDTQFSCSLCGQKFHLKCELHRHMKSHHASDRRHECDICNKTFKRGSGLRRHAQSHLQDRKFHECHVCGKKCTQRNNLRVHMRVHSSTKAFTCEHCGQGFNYNQSLQTHIRKKHIIESLSEHLEDSKSKEDTVLTEKLALQAPTDPQPNANPVVANTAASYPEQPVVFPSADTSQQPYYPDPSGGYVPVNADFQRSYNNLINTIVRSEQEPGVGQQQGYPVFYPQF